MPYRCIHCHHRVYPRACGGTASRIVLSDTLYGLSPRVRGNQSGSIVSTVRAGSIPARAGEPKRSWGKGWCATVYPRACGGTPLRVRPWDLMRGLSPRVRGNRLPRGRWACRRGSIPARAGEPPGGATIRETTPVYPRACGGTEFFLEPQTARDGLSPRVRGNPACRPQCGQCAGSIPARAGEPNSRRGCAARSSVYPRACGGTAGGAGWKLLNIGLSPRVRGNRLGDSRIVRMTRSIPARAGEPRSGSTR